LTLDFGLEFLSFITGGGTPTTGSARVVLTGVDELGRITESSARGSLESFVSVTTGDDGVGMAVFELRLEDPVSASLEMEADNPDGVAFRFTSGILLTSTCVGSAAVCPADLHPAFLSFVSFLNLGVPGAAGLRVFFTGESFLIGLASGSETARSFVRAEGEAPEPLAGALLLLGLSAQALRATWRRRA
jgi:hypothetical protein